ncbi:type III secretion system inner membrane ring lipoprotein SctJ [Chitinimonas sp. BJB300]|uniref:type III secretion system inner membrane ring lipoprotein SctJ n=1 Tax=Chitinimonas sp. BJB300 TaxID=1559339 RepID=UPI000C0EF0F3|nr:type III secretion inner membrane ring lipoprotein SctJ [Chitinimonas sp. BJB300]PHV11498.1 EscJ/YscJ/HrcJ family type III secretion inner membrane ring protein [Chitinimonas sp. BJB300]TSJ88507.1 EscJ/YscJ/HrcJ family type III secretion inner membrane ring protein [Chitinimonas sp. BJB300]
MKTPAWKIFLLALPLLLTGCNVDLYSKLDEAEANQMMALLIYHQIPAEKQANKDGITVRVDDARFVDAVEVLRQNGLPRRKTVGIQDLFPSGQLVSSPEQESAKLLYLKSQQLEKMLNSMDGVVRAEVSVAEPRPRDNQSEQAASAAVFIKYSPEVNLPARTAEIRNLIRDGIPNLSPDRISVTLQRAEFRYLAPPKTPAPNAQAIPQRWLWAAGGGVLLLLALGLMVFAVRGRKPRAA